MIEIALCVMVIGFALVAILAVLPAGMQTQRDNRIETLVAEDGIYWMDAIRSGARGLDELTNFVEQITVGGTTLQFGSGFSTGEDIIGLLSTPGGAQALVRSLSGAAAERAEETRDLAFKYELEVEIQTADSRTAREVLDDGLSELRLTFRWRPGLPREKQHVRVFRAQVLGTPVEDPPGSQRFFFHPR